jgi:hypothetical protein
MKQSKAQDIVIRLLTLASEVRYGSVSASLKLHDGRVVSVSYSTTEQTREYEQHEAVPKDDKNDEGVCL